MKKLIIASLFVASSMSLTVQASQLSYEWTQQYNYCVGVAEYIENISHVRDSGYSLEDTKSDILHSHYELGIDLYDTSIILDAVDLVFVRPYMTPVEEGSFAFDNCMSE